MKATTRLALSFVLLSGTLAVAAEPAAVAEKKSLTLEGAKRVAAADLAVESRELRGDGRRWVCAPVT
jgi:hypothetical protein